jgi:hypothetical protein
MQVSIEHSASTHYKELPHRATRYTTTQRGVPAVMHNALALRNCNIFHIPQGTPAAGVLAAEAKPLRTQRERGREMREDERGVLAEGGGCYPGNRPS